MCSQLPHSLGLEFNFHAKITIMTTEETIVTNDKERTTYITGFISDSALQDDNDRSAVVDGDDDMPGTNQDVVYIETE